MEAMELVRYTIVKNKMGFQHPRVAWRSFAKYKPRDGKLICSRALQPNDDTTSTSEGFLRKMPSSHGQLATAWNNMEAVVNNVEPPRLDFHNSSTIEWEADWERMSDEEFRSFLSTSNTSCSGATDSSFSTVEEYNAFRERRSRYVRTVVTELRKPLQGVDLIAELKAERAQRAEIGTDVADDADDADDVDDADVKEGLATANNMEAVVNNMELPCLDFHSSSSDWEVDWERMSDQEFWSFLSTLNTSYSGVTDSSFSTVEEYNAFRERRLRYLRTALTEIRKPFQGVDLIAELKAERAQRAEIGTNDADVKEWLATAWNNMEAVNNNVEPPRLDFHSSSIEWEADWE